MDKELQKLGWIQMGNFTFNISVYSFCMVYLTKCVNMSLDVSQLNVANMAVGLATIGVLQVLKQDAIINLLQKNVVALLVVDHLLEWLIVATILYDPMTYIIGMALFKATVSKMTNTSFNDLHNAIYPGRMRTKWHQSMCQYECAGLVIGGVLGWFINDLPLVWVVVIGASARMIDIPLSLWRVRIMFTRIKRLNLKVE